MLLPAARSGTPRYAAHLALARVLHRSSASSSL